MIFIVTGVRADIDDRDRRGVEIGSGVPAKPCPRDVTCLG